MAVGVMAGEPSSLGCEARSAVSSSDVNLNIASRSRRWFGLRCSARPSGGGAGTTNTRSKFEKGFAVGMTVADVARHTGVAVRTQPLTRDGAGSSNRIDERIKAGPSLVSNHKQGGHAFSPGVDRGVVAKPKPLEIEFFPAPPRWLGFMIFSSSERELRRWSY